MPTNYFITILRMTKNYLLILLSLSIIGCSKPKDETPLSITSKIPYDIKVTGTKENFTWNEKIENTEIIPLSKVSASLLSSIDKGIVYKGMVYLLDIKSRRLITFDKKGNFKGLVGMVGTAKGQYLEARDFTIENDIIYVLDYKKIHAYSIYNNNRYIKDIDFTLDPKTGQNPSKFILFDEDNLLFWTSSPDVFHKDQGTYFRVQHYQNEKAEEAFFKYDHEIFDKDRFSKSYTNEYYLIPPDGGYDIYQIKPNSINGFMKLDFGPDSLPQNYNKDGYDPKKFNDYLRNKYYKSINSFLKISENLFYFDCLGNAGYTYQGLVDIRNQKVDFGALEIPYSPRIFFSDKDFIYGYYNPSYLLNFMKDKTNNALFETLKAKLPGLKDDDNLVLVKFSIKKSLK